MDRMGRILISTSNDNFTTGNPSSARGLIAFAILVFVIQTGAQIGIHRLIGSAPYGADAYVHLAGSLGNQSIRREAITNFDMFLDELNNDTPEVANIRRALGPQGIASLEALEKNPANQQAQNRLVVELNKKAQFYLPTLAKFNSYRRDGGVTHPPPEITRLLLDTPNFGTIVDKVFDARTDPVRYIPLSWLYVVGLSSLNDHGETNGIVSVIVGAAVVGVATAFAMLVAGTLLNSVWWGLFTALLWALSPAVVQASFAVMALPYLVVCALLFAAIYFWLLYARAQNLLWIWPLAFVMLVAPLVREFGSVVPFVILGLEVIRLKCRRFSPLLIAALPFLLHAVFPALLPSIVGLNDGEIVSVLGQSKVISQSNDASLLLGMWGLMLVQVPPSLLFLALFGVVVVTWMGTSEKIHMRVIISFFPVMIAAIAFVVIAFPGPGHGFDHPSIAFQHFLLGGVIIASVVALIMFIGLRFEYVSPFWMLVCCSPFLIVRLAEIHLVYASLPMMIILSSYIKVIGERLHASNVRLAFAALLVLLTIDQGVFVKAAVETQRKLLQTHRAIAAELKDQASGDLVIGNFLSLVDIYYYTKYAFDPWFTNHNNALGGAVRTAHTRAEIENIIDLNAEFRDIYLIPAAPDYAPWRRAYHRHQVVNQFPDEIQKLKTWPVQTSYVYLDPLRRAISGTYTSLPAYMDWETDIAVSRNGWSRQVATEYLLYRYAYSR